jgi:hypothetical protein
MSALPLKAARKKHCRAIRLHSDWQLLLLLLLLSSGHHAVLAAAAAAAYALILVTMNFVSSCLWPVFLL